MHSQKRAPPRPRTASALSEDVDKKKQKHPHDIPEMPIPTRRLNTKVISSSEVLVLHGPNQLNQQHRHAHCHVKTVEARQHEIGGAINA